MSTLAVETSADLDPTAPVVAVLLHGFGSNQHDLAGLGPHLPAGLGWISPRGPLEVPPGGAAWFPITTPGSPEVGDVDAATTALWGWLDQTFAPTTRLAVIGFSQGGFMATQLLRTRPGRIAATVVLGGFVTQHPQAADQQVAADRPPVFWGRGEQDRVIAAAAVERTAAWLPGHSTLTERTYPGLAHGINGEEWADVVDFLAPLV